MVYDKKRSGDPDYDDKVPAEQHAHEMVTAPNGDRVALTESAGPVGPDGAHVNLDGPTADELDNRPTPGQVATEASTVQTVHPDDERTELDKGKRRP